MKRFLALAVAVLFMTAPLTLHADARPGTTTVRIRTTSYRDHAPRLHMHSVLPHH